MLIEVVVDRELGPSLSRAEMCMLSLVKSFVLWKDEAVIAYPYLGDGIQSFSSYLISCD